MTRDRGKNENGWVFRTGIRMVFFEKAAAVVLAFEILESFCLLWPAPFSDFDYLLLWVPVRVRTVGQGKALYIRLARWKVVLK